MPNTHNEIAEAQHMQNGGKVQSVERRKVLVVRLSAIGDCIIAARALRLLLEEGLDPVFCTQSPCDDVALSVPGLRFVVLAQRDGRPQLLARSSDNDVTWVRTDGLEGLGLCEQTLLSVLDLQCTARSRRFLRNITSELPGKKFRILRVKKRSLERIGHVFLARFSWTQKGANGERQSVFSVPAKLERIHNLQESLVQRFMAEMKVAREQRIARVESLRVNPKLNETWLVVSKDVEQNLEIQALQTAPYVVLFTGASGPLKQWSLQRFSELIAQVSAKKRVKFVVIGGKDEVSDGTELCRQYPGLVVDMCGKLKVGDTLSLIAGAHYVVTGDSFPAHAADALDVPASVIFGATTPWFGFVPLSSRIRIHYLELSCSPCTRHGRGSCRFGNLRCMEEISAKSVATELLSELASLSD